MGRYDVPGYDPELLRLVDEIKGELFPEPDFQVGRSGGYRTIGHGTRSMRRASG
jgi:hypothetical protein